jgi:phosphate transport system substrate-binding protein
MTNLNSKLLGGAAVALLAAAFAAPAQAQTVPLHSGGGTLAEKVYRDIFNCYGNHSGGDLTLGLAGPATGCNAVTPYRSNVEPIYVGVGSGNGKKAFVNHDASKFTDGPRTPDATPNASPSDFGPFYGTGTGAGWVRDTTDTGPFPSKVSFVGSDDPLLPADITTYNTVSGGSWGAPIQVPGLITTIAIPFKPIGTWNEKGKTQTGGSSKVQLSTNTLCGIFTGNITNWSDAAITADNAGFQLGSGAITVTYRSDGSGSTFLTSNGLINQCVTTSYPVPASWQTATGNSSGVGNNSFFVNVKNAIGLPANFVGASGSGGMKTAINATAGAIGYISPDFALPIDPTGPQAANLQTWASFVAAGTKVYKAPTAKNGTAIMGAVKAPLFTKNSCPTAPGGICAHDPLNWGVTNSKPLSAGAYPIGGFTFIDTYTCYTAAADVDAIAGVTPGALGLFRWFFGTTTDNSLHVKTELTNNGFSLVPGGWISAAKKLLTTNKPTKIGTPGQANTGCVAVTGGA